MNLQRGLSASVLALSLVAAAGCATEPSFQSKEVGGTNGYTDQRLGPNRYRVTYTGSVVTSRNTVENYLLLRAAQVTLDSGFDFFVFDTRDTKRNTRYYTDFTGWPGWRGRGWYWHSWDAFGPPYDEQTRAISRYEAYSEIVMLTPSQAKNEPKAVDAHDIVAHLTPPPPPR